MGVGDTEGAKEGLWVGMELGEELGKIVGAAEGANESFKVGKRLGASEAILGADDGGLSTSLVSASLGACTDAVLKLLD
jgi:hypothetical protein